MKHHNFAQNKPYLPQISIQSLGTLNRKKCLKVGQTSKTLPPLGVTQRIPDCWDSAGPPGVRPPRPCVWGGCKLQVQALRDLVWRSFLEKTTWTFCLSCKATKGSLPAVRISEEAGQASTQDAFAPHQKDSSRGIQSEARRMKLAELFLMDGERKWFDRRANKLPQRKPVSHQEQIGIFGILGGAKKIKLSTTDFF